MEPEADGNINGRRIRTARDDAISLGTNSRRNLHVGLYKNLGPHVNHCAHTLELLLLKKHDVIPKFRADAGCCEQSTEQLQYDGILFCQGGVETISPSNESLQKAVELLHASKHWQATGGSCSCARHGARKARKIEGRQLMKEDTWEDTTWEDKIETRVFSAYRPNVERRSDDFSISVQGKATAPMQAGDDSFMSMCDLAMRQSMGKLGRRARRVLHHI
jgi:hypothetical protein